MAGKTGSKQAVVETAYWRREQLFSALRRLECQFSELPRIGRAISVDQEAIRIGQSDFCGFHPTALTDCSDNAKPIALKQAVLGLLGSNGPMPGHFSEYVAARKHQHGDATWVEFLDLFNHRAISLFYRCWAESQPVVSADRPDELDSFYLYLAALCGSQTGRTDVPATGVRPALEQSPSTFQQFTSGLLGMRASEESIERVIACFLQAEVSVEGFKGDWYAVPAPSRASLGASSASGPIGLGYGQYLGQRFYSSEFALSIKIGPLKLPQYISLLPGKRALVSLLELLQFQLSDAKRCIVSLSLDRASVPSSELNGTMQLGWTSWLPAAHARESDPDDLQFTLTATAVTETGRVSHGNDQSPDAVQ